MCRNKQRLAESNTLTNYTGYYTYFLTIPCLPQAWTNVSLSSVIWSDVSHLLMIITIFTYSLMDYFLWLTYRKFRIFWVIGSMHLIQVLRHQMSIFSWHVIQNPWYSFFSVFMIHIFDFYIQIKLDLRESKIYKNIIYYFAHYSNTLNKLKKPNNTFATELHFNFFSYSF